MRYPLKRFRGLQRQQQQSDAFMGPVLLGVLKVRFTKELQLRL